MMKYKRHSEDSSNYLEVIVYNKTKEIENRIASGKTSKDELVRYKDVIRTEVKVKNGKLNSNKSQDQLNHKTDIRNKSLENYYNDTALQNYYSRNIKKIFGTEAFYRIDTAINLIDKEETIKPKMKEKLITLIKLINTEGYTKAKNIWVDTFSLTTFNTHIKRIRKLGINVITFDKVINGVTIDYEYIPNFSLLDNAEIEFIPIKQITF